MENTPTFSRQERIILKLFNLRLHFFFLLLLFYPYFSFGQGLLNLNKIEIGGNYSQFGSGGKEGFGLSNELQFGNWKRISLNLGLKLLNGSSQYDSYYEKYLGGPKTENAIFRASTSVFQLDLKPTVNFPFRKFNLAIGLGPLVSYRVDTLPRGFTVFYPVYTNLPEPIYTINYIDLNKYKTFEFGLIAKSSVSYSINKRFSINLGIALQKDTKDLIWQYPAGIGIQIDSFFS
jgi:hypothetical protein